MPLLGLSSIAAAAIPLTSCDKAQQFDGKVTDAEFKASVYKLYNVTDSRNFTIEDKVYYEDSTDPETDTYYVDKGSIYAHHEEDTDDAELEQYGCRWHVYKSWSSWRPQEVLDKNESYVQRVWTIALLYELLDEKHLTIDDFEFNTSTKTYKYDGSISNAAKYELYFKYNSDKNIEYLEYDVLDSNATIKKVETKVSNYGVTELPDEFKSIVITNLFEVSNVETADLLYSAPNHTASIYNQFFYVVDLSKLKWDTTYIISNLKAYAKTQGSEVQDALFYKDYIHIYRSNSSGVKELVQDTDYSLSSDKKNIQNFSDATLITDKLIFKITYNSLPDPTVRFYIGNN